MNLIQKTIYVSLTAQIIAMVISIAGLGIPIAPQNSILRSILGMESIVQVIESMFYTWFGIFSPKSSSKTDIAKYRYYDWFITTPTMLLSTMMYFKHRNETRLETFEQREKDNEENNEENKERKTETETKQQIKFGNIWDEIKNMWKTMKSFTSNNWGSVSKILLFNTLMLLMGYLRESGVLSVFSSTLVGFLFFGAMFYLLFTEFVKNNTKNYGVYFTMLGLWGLYGVAATFGNVMKNTSFNILDIFSKNFYSVFIAVYIYTLYKG